MATTEMADRDSDQSETIAFLSDPHSYGVDKVERRETHGAIVFLAGGRAYKLKRAVKYPYMDFSTVARREAMCRKELEVNRRSAPDLYLEVRPLVRKDGRIAFGKSGGETGAVDWVVVLRRFAEEDLLEERRKAGTLDLSLMRDLGEMIAHFHEKAPARATFGGSKAIASVIDENIEALSGVPELFAPSQVQALAARARAALKGLAPSLDRRRDDGLVRRCHGDLHLNNIFLENGKPVLFDAIEFEDAFACVDVFYDLAFLLMDLAHHGLVAHANRVLNRYLELTFDFEGLRALPLYLSCRAGLRAHVTASASRLAQDPSRAKRLRKNAQAFFASALAYLDPGRPQILAIGGVSGTGKSTLAYALAPLFAPTPGAVVLRSDIFRKRLADAAETERLPETAYSAKANADVYAALDKAASEVVTAGYAVIVDAVHGRESDRVHVAAVAAHASVPFTGLWLAAGTTTLETRIRGRRGDASDATVEVLRRQLESVSVPSNWRTADVSGSAEESLAAAKAALKDVLSDKV